MKKVKVGLGVFLAAVLIGSFFFGTAHAQPDLSRWQNQWFSVSGKSSGWEIEGGATTILTSGGSIKGFLELGALTFPSLAAYLYGPDLNGSWELLATGSCEYMAGNEWDFICDLSQGGVSPFNAGIDAFIRITGKSNTKTVPPSLKSATLKSSGGAFSGNVDPEFPNTLSIGGITLTGKWLDLTTFCKGKNVTTPPCL